jgi:hypothetical protein
MADPIPIALLIFILISFPLPNVTPETASFAS